MAKIEMINEDPFCPVQLENIQHNGRETDKHMIAMQLPGEEEEFVPIPGVGTVHSADYKLVTNRQVHDMAMQVMEKTGINLRPLPSQSGGKSSRVYWNGRRYSEKWYCEDTSVDVPGGSAMRLGVEVTNSYDGSCKVGLAFFSMHMVCANQFYSSNMLGRPYEFPHVSRGGNLEDDIELAMGQIEVQATNFAKIGPNMEKLRNHTINDLGSFLKLREQIKNETRVEFRDKQLLDELTGNGITAELGMSEVKYNVDKPSYWDVANAYTAVATHVVGGPRGADQSGRVMDWLISTAGE